MAKQARSLPAGISDGDWQLAAEPLRARVGGGQTGSFRPILGVLLHADSHFCLKIEVGHEGETSPEVAARLLSAVLREVRLPQAIQVRDPELATALRQRFAQQRVSFEVVEALEAVDDLYREMQKDLFPSPVKPLLDQPGVTLGQLAGFAEACALWHAARPWIHLHDDDMIEIEAPPAPLGMRCAAVMGAGGHTFGVSFAASRDAHRAVEEAGDPGRLPNQATWSLMFFEHEEAPVDDIDLWEQNGFRVTADESIPVLLRYGPGKDVHRPGPLELAFAEGICRALAATTEEEIDSGRWEKVVRSGGAEVTYRLTIPHLLDAPARTPAPGPMSVEGAMRDALRRMKEAGISGMEDAQRFLREHLNSGEQPTANVSMAPRERAMDLCYQAAEARSRRALQLLREALKLDPDCAEAFNMLARRHSDPADKEKLYRRAVEAGRKALGETPFQDPEYPFWGVLETRPFMRAMSGLAQSLEEQERLPEAADILKEMLRLNPNDNQGVRYTYVGLMIEMERPLEARRVLDAYRGETCAIWEFAEALLAYQNDDTVDFRKWLAKGATKNPHVLPMLLDPETEAPASPGWSPGHESEAEIVVELIGHLYLRDDAIMREVEDFQYERERKREKRQNRKRDQKKRK